MAHTTGFATSPNDLLDKIRIWLLTRGWSLNAYVAEGNGYRLHMQKGSTYLNLRSFVSEGVGFRGNNQGGTGLALTLGSGFNAGASFAGQPGIPILKSGYGTGPMGAVILLHAGPYISHQFFDDEMGNILLMVERNPGAWRHLAWGDSLDKSGAGSWNGGAYFSANNSGGVLNATDTGSIYTDAPPMNNGGGAWLRADVDTFTGKWLLVTRYEDTATDPVNKSATNGFRSWQSDSFSSSWSTVPVMGLSLRNRLYNIQDSRAILLPMMIFAHRDLGGASFLGTVPSLYLSAARGNGIADGQDLTIGSETYRQFSGFFVRLIG